MAGYRYWTERVSAKRYIFTGPEFLIPTGLLEQALTVQEGTTLHFKCLWIPAAVQAQIEQYPWRTPEAMTETLTSGDFIGGINGAPANTNVPGITTWDSNSTWAVCRDTLERMLPFPIFNQWGPDDPYMHYLRTKLGIVNVTNMSHYVYHQHHAPSYRPEGWDFDMTPYVALADAHVRSVLAGTKSRVIPGIEPAQPVQEAPMSADQSYYANYGGPGKPYGFLPEWLNFFRFVATMLATLCLRHDPLLVRGTERAALHFRLDFCGSATIL